ncbi:HAD family hydrolase [Zavarzinella formosa]|uniref:HAD family hydrolase n=1 Tax=Zavarzinella formosa TaxID=360055 RepID=UPI0003702294|nr:HAD family hydrolase [Zavarzinella formosa]
MRVLLFDIDGTLIRSGGAGKYSMEAALQAAFGLTEIRDRVSYSGRTDRAIIHDLLLLHDLAATPENARLLEAAYLAHLPEALATREGLVLPGIVETLARKHDGIAIGLLTGNVAAGAAIKLKHYGLADHFAFGGFADNLSRRDDVARRAFAEAERHLNMKLDPANVWVIGDTPADVQCARAIGAKAIAVQTGWHTPEELAAAGPDHLFPDFTHARELWPVWGMME